MKENTITTDLTEGNVARQLIRFSIPFLLANILQTVYNLTDMVIVGQVVGSVGLSAIANGGDLMNLFMLLGMGFASAGQIIISQYAGAKDREGVRSTIGTLLASVTVLALVVMTIGLCFLDGCLRALNVPQQAYDQARDYSFICLIGMVFIYGYNAVSSILRGLGDSKHPLLFIAISTSLNVVLDIVLVYYAGMGAKGAAVATVIGQGVAFVCSIVFLVRSRDSLGLSLRPTAFRPDRAVLKNVLKLGVPLAIHSAAVHFSMLYVTSYINTYGVAVSAITGVGNKIGGVATVVTDALGVAGGAMIGQNFGAGKMERISRILRINLIIGLVFSLLLCAILLLRPMQVFRLWSQDEAVLALVPDYLPVVMLNLVGFALRAPCFSLLNGIGYASMSFAVGMLDGVVFRIGLSLVLGIGLGWGIHGFWYGAVLAGFTACFIVGPYYFSGRWKKRKPVTG